MILNTGGQTIPGKPIVDAFNGNLIISGAFGLFKKDVVIAAGGYASDTLDEDMELVIKLHAYCRQNLIDYQIRYEPDAVCWSQTPCSLRDLIKQRRRWHLGLFQCLMRYRFMFGKLRYGMAGTVSYLYYLLYELFSPQIELLGLLMVVLAGGMGLLNVPFMVNLFLLFGLYGSTLTMTAFFQRIYTQNLRIRPSDVLQACLACLAENIFFRFFLDFVRTFAFVGYLKRKHQWGQIQRKKNVALPAPLPRYCSAAGMKKTCPQMGQVFLMLCAGF